MINDALLPADSPLVDPHNCIGPAQKSGDWGEMALCMMAMAADKDPHVANGGWRGYSTKLHVVCAHILWQDVSSGTYYSFVLPSIHFHHLAHRLKHG